MGISTRRDSRSHRKMHVGRRRGSRAIASFAAFGVVTALTFGSATMASATEALIEDEGVSTNQVESAPIVESTPDPIVEAPAAEPAPAPPAEVQPAAEEVALEAPVVVDEVVEQPAPASPVEAVEDSVAAPLTIATNKGGGEHEAKKVYVCKYVGTPGVDERLKDGRNPISVSVRAIQNNQWDGTVPGWFSDAHDRSYVLAYDTGQPKPNVSECHAPETPPTCVQNPTWSYTFDGVGSGTVTASAKKAKQGDTLCDPLAVRAATYSYDPPASGNPSWPQTPVGANDVLVDTIGTFSYAAPALDTCRQHDAYAEFVSKGGFEALAIPEKLFGPGNPFEPQFLHQALAGKGPNPTWSTTTSEGCNLPDPEVVTGAGTFSTLTCELGTSNHAELDAVPTGVWTFTDKNGGVYVTAAGEAYDGGVPGGLAYGDITVTLSQSEDGDTSAYEVTPWSGVWTTVDPASLDCEEEPWTPGSSLELKVEDCFVEGEDPVLVHGTFEVVEGELIGELTVDGEVPPGDTELRVGPGVHTYTYVVTNVETGETLLFEGSFTVDVCEEEPPVVTPPPTDPPTTKPTPPGTNTVPGGKTDGFGMQTESNSTALLSVAAMLMALSASLILYRQRQLSGEQEA